MKIEILSSKIHRARVTDANLNYVGSITIGPELIEAAGLCEYQKVEILNVNNGERFATYVIHGEKKGEICLNGAAARKVCVGDVVIIVAYALLSAKKSERFRAKNRAGKRAKRDRKLACRRALKSFSPRRSTTKNTKRG